MPNHVAIVPVKVKPGREQDFIDAATVCVAATRKEDGVLMYELSRSKKNPSEFFFYEVYKSPEAQKEHGQTPHLQAFKEKMGDILLEPFALTIFESVDTVL